MRIPGSVTGDYHKEHYGAEFAYEQFAPEFNTLAQQWDPSAWADLFSRAGAQYVVLTTKHHDGFLLWPSRRPNPFRANYHASRDLVGELTEAVRGRNMRMGLYYSGGLDWTFEDRVIADLPDLLRATPQSDDYSAYADEHIHELIDRYAPSVLWNDIGYPAASNVPALFARYYNQVTEGVVNDRFTQIQAQNLPENLADLLAHGMPRPQHFDFRTPEYAVFDEIRSEKWESCRGLGFSFGYNRNETPDTMLSPTELIHSFVDIVSKNGNLLLNIGPRADGSIPAEQQERLLALGNWLAVNGQAIYGTHPWRRADGTTAGEVPVRFTQRDASLYAIVLEAPAAPQVVITDLPVEDTTTIRLLGSTTPLEWKRNGQGVEITLPTPLPDAPAYALQISPQPV
jgi:alpha-L-fucosidase